MSRSDGFEWDEAKRKATVAKHGLDFVDVVAVFAAEPLIVRSAHEGEDRWLAIGRVRDVTVTVIFTRRGPAIRIVTTRRARQNERRALDAHDAGRGAGT